MPSPHRALDRASVAEHVRRDVFDGDADRAGLGIELEWLTSHDDNMGRLAVEVAEELITEVDPLPNASRVTIEPGGQLELSGQPVHSIDQACADMATDLYLVDQACQERGISLIALGADPLRSPERVVGAQRYQAMQTYFDARGPAGRTMMCNTASIQVNVGLGPPDLVDARWRLAHAIGPALVAAFTNSPLADGQPTGWQSSRLRSWWMLDPTRSSPVEQGPSPADAWTDYALDALVMLIEDAEGRFVPITDELTFGDWVRHGHDLGWPTFEDFQYHLTTLFPPVRPRGWFELRFFDALPTPFWHVAVAVAAVLLLDERAAPLAQEASRSTAGLWTDAAQLGLGHPGLAQAGKDLFDIALWALRTRPDGEISAEIVALYHDHWIARGRSPADDRRQDWLRDRSVLPPPRSPVPLPSAFRATPSR